jgi:hypothetical protein
VDYKSIAHRTGRRDAAHPVTVAPPPPPGLALAGLRPAATSSQIFYLNSLLQSLLVCWETVVAFNAPCATVTRCASSPYGACSMWNL